MHEILKKRPSDPTRQGAAVLMY